MAVSARPYGAFRQNLGRRCRRVAVEPTPSTERVNPQAAQQANTRDARFAYTQCPRWTYVGQIGIFSAPVYFGVAFGEVSFQFLTCNNYASIQSK